MTTKTLYQIAADIGLPPMPRAVLPKIAAIFDRLDDMDPVDLSNSLEAMEGEGLDLFDMRGHFHPATVDHFQRDGHPRTLCQALRDLGALSPELRGAGGWVFSALAVAAGERCAAILAADAAAA